MLDFEASLFSVLILSFEIDLINNSRSFISINLTILLYFILLNKIIRYIVLC